MPIKSKTCLWYTVAGSKLVRMIVTRDPKGRFEDRAYFTTDPEMTTEYIARTFSLRWNPLPTSPRRGGAHWNTAMSNNTWGWKNRKMDGGADRRAGAETRKFPDLSRTKNAEQNQSTELSLSF